MNLQVLVLHFGLFAQTLLLASGCHTSEKYPAPTECNSIIDTRHLSGLSYKLFIGTPVCELAIRLIKNQDTSGVSEFVRLNKINVDYQEPRFGMTLLMQAVYLRKYESCHALLKLGADPDKKNLSSDGESSIIIACMIQDDSLKILKLLLANGANANDTSSAEHGGDPGLRTTPLLKACSVGAMASNSLERVKLLIASGANINYKNGAGYTPLGSAIIGEAYGIALYLLEQGADFRNPVLKQTDNSDAYIVDILRKALLPLDSKVYQDKMKVVSFLETQGINYWKTPIPQYIQEKIKQRHPNDWEEYMKKY